jgi:hypothetical protein
MSDEDSVTCPICLEALTPVFSFFVTGCGHAYHTPCWNKYCDCALQREECAEVVCPLCKTRLCRFGVWGQSGGTSHDILVHVPPTLPVPLVHPAVCINMLCLVLLMTQLLWLIAPRNCR